MKSFLHSIALAVVVVCVLCPFHVGLGQDATEFHRFIPKEGNPIEAKLLTVSEDWKDMKIQSREGKIFSVGINVLTLDDQQFVKEWIQKKADTDLADFELDVKMMKRKGAANRKNVSLGVVLESRELSYEITITNESSETLTAPIIEYVIFYENGVNLIKTLDDDLNYTLDHDYSIRGFSGQGSLEELSFNREQTFRTKGVEIHKVGDDDSTYGEDRAFGILVKISTPTGEVVGLYRAGGSEIDGFSWDAAEKLAGGNGPRKRKRKRDQARPEVLTKLAKGNSLGGPVYFEGRTVEIAATVSPSGRGKGVIVAAGGSVNGLSLYVEDRKVNFSQVVDGDVKTVSVPLPLGEFTVKATLGETMLSLAVNEKDTSEAEGHGFFEDYAQAGVDIGEDIASAGGQGVVGPYVSPARFAGTIRKCTILFGAIDGDDE